MTTVDIGKTIDEGRWTPYLKFLVFLAALAIIFDGIDNQLLAVSIPSLMKEWGVKRSEFQGIVALGMFGMIIGGALAGVAGDRVGRKTAMIASVFVFAVMSLAIAGVQTMSQLGAIRFLAGIGLGGAMPNAAALASEYVPRRQRAIAVTLTIVCVPLGAMLAGWMAGRILPTLGWRWLFVIGSGIPLAAVFLLMSLQQESPRFLAARPARWPRLVAFLRRAGHEVPDDAVFIDTTEKAVRTSMGTLFREGFARDTLALWGAFFSCLLAVYAGFNWIPSLLAGAGRSVAEGADGIFYFNLGGVIGAICAGVVIGRIGSRVTMLIMSAAAIAAAVILSRMPISASVPFLPILAMLVVLGGLLNAVQTTMYALAAHVYPTSMRATGVGTAVAVGRFGAVLSASLGSAMIERGGPPYYFLMIAGAAVVVFATLALVGNHIKPLSSSN